MNIPAEAYPLTWPARLSNDDGLCEPFLVPFYANGQADSTDDAMQLDIRFRMLQPHELSAAMGFPVGYRITGNRSEQVRQIGNAVEVNVARELCRAILEK